MTTEFGTLISKNRDNLVYLTKKDKRMRFNNSKDPIYFIFDHIENRPVSVLAKEFVQDTLSDICNFVSKVVAQSTKKLKKIFYHRIKDWEIGKLLKTRGKRFEA